MDNRNNENFEKFEALRTKVETIIKAKRKHYYEQKFFRGIGDSKQVYNFFNEPNSVTIINSNVPYPIKNGRRTGEKLDDANELNTFS